MNKTIQNSRIVIYPFAVLLFGLLLFAVISVIIDPWTIYLGEKNIYFTAITPSIVYWSFYHTIRIGNIKKYILLFYLTPFLWALCLCISYYYMILGLTSDSMQILYIASQVLYVGGWIVLLSVLPKVQESKSIPWAGIIAMIVFTVLLILFKESHFKRDMVLYLFMPIPFQLPLLLLEILFMLLSVSIFTYIRKNNKYALWLCCVLAAMPFMHNGKLFINSMKYDYVIWGPSLLALILSMEILLWRTIIKIKNLRA